MQWKLGLLIVATLGVLALLFVPFGSPVVITVNLPPGVEPPSESQANAYVSKVSFVAQALMFCGVLVGSGLIGRSIIRRAKEAKEDPSETF